MAGSAALKSQVSLQEGFCLAPEKINIQRYMYHHHI